MDENPELAPKPAPTPKASSAGAASGAYASPPDEAARESRRRPFALAPALLLAAGGVGVFVSRRAAPPPETAVQTVAQTVAQTVDASVWSQKDYDAETTAAARDYLKRDPAARAPLPTDASPGPVQPEPLRQALRALAAGAQELRDGVAQGRIGFYTFALPQCAGEGDVYDVSVDGSPLLRVTAQAGVSSVTIPLETAKPHAVAQTLVFAKPRGVYVANPAAETPTAALTDLSLEAAVSRTDRTVDLSVKRSEEPPKASVARPKVKAVRCIVHLRDSNGKNDHVIGDFPCDCDLVHWKGNVGSCSVGK